jgi:hypothetical protein
MALLHLSLHGSLLLCEFAASPVKRWIRFSLPKLILSLPCSFFWSVVSRYDARRDLKQHCVLSFFFSLHARGWDGCLNWDLQICQLSQPSRPEPSARREGASSDQRFPAQPSWTADPQTLS